MTKVGNEKGDEESQAGAPKQACEDAASAAASAAKDDDGVAPEDRRHAPRRRRRRPEPSRFPLFFVLVASAVLLFATGSHYEWKIAKRGGTAYSRYAISVSSIAIVLSLVGLVLMRASSKLYAAACKQIFVTLFAYSFLGACFLTFREPFTETSNGYFAAWATAYGSALAIGMDPSALESGVRGLGAVIGLFASSFIVLIASVDPVRDGCPNNDPDAFLTGGCHYKGEASYALALACYTLVFVLILAVMDVAGRGAPGALQFSAMAALAMCWIVMACLVTFRGPFVNTGNGYFGSWAGAAMSLLAVFANLQASG